MSACKLAVALDVTDRDSFLQWSETLKGLPVVMKLGLGLLPLLEPGDIKRLRDEGFEIFIDAKLHDIPSQVARAVTAWAFLGVHYLTLHLSGGTRMLGFAAENAVDTKIRLLGVTVLTSLSAVDLGEVGQGKEVSAQVSRLSEVALKAGVESFVSSVGEIEVIRKAAQKLGKKSFHVTPGLVMSRGQSHADQSRVYTIDDALRAGSDMLVVGRTIVDSKDPRQTTEEILELIKKA